MEQIYINVSVEEQSVILFGIKFSDFVENTLTPIDNILLLKSGFLAPKNIRGFEVLEGHDSICGLSREDICGIGDFSFVDYSGDDSVNKLSEEQIAELLYLAHTHRPLKSAFFDVLKNNFVYLSHDDGWYCKLFCKDVQVSVSIFINTIQKKIRDFLHDSEYVLCENLVAEIRNLSTKGLIVSLDFSKQQGTEMIQLCEVGNTTPEDFH